MTTIHVPSLDKLPEAAEKFVETMGDETVYAFYGDMGAGKTTFINALCRRLGVEDYFDSGALCFLEWPERIADILPDDTVRVDIRVNDDNTRDIIIND